MKRLFGKLVRKDGSARAHAGEEANVVSFPDIDHIEESGNPSLSPSPRGPQAPDSVRPLAEQDRCLVSGQVPPFLAHARADAQSHTQFAADIREALRMVLTGRGPSTAANGAADSADTIKLAGVQRLVSLLRASAPARSASQPAAGVPAAVEQAFAASSPETLEPAIQARVPALLVQALQVLVNAEPGGPAAADARPSPRAGPGRPTALRLSPVEGAIAKCGSLLCAGVRWAAVVEQIMPFLPTLLEFACSVPEGGRWPAPHADAAAAACQQVVDSIASAASLTPLATELLVRQRALPRALAAPIRASVSSDLPANADVAQHMARAIRAAALLARAGDAHAAADAGPMADAGGARPGARAGQEGEEGAPAQPRPLLSRAFLQARGRALLTDALARAPASAMEPLAETALALLTAPPYAADTSQRGGPEQGTASTSPRGQGALRLPQVQRPASARRLLPTQPGRISALAVEVGHAVSDALERRLTSASGPTAADAEPAAAVLIICLRRAYVVDPVLCAALEGRCSALSRVLILLQQNPNPRVEHCLLGLLEAVYTSLPSPPHEPLSTVVVTLSRHVYRAMDACDSLFAAQGRDASQAASPGSATAMHAAAVGVTAAQALCGSLRRIVAFDSAHKELIRDSGVFDGAVGLLLACAGTLEAWAAALEKEKGKDGEVQAPAPTTSSHGLRAVRSAAVAMMHATMDAVGSLLVDSALGTERGTAALRASRLPTRLIELFQLPPWALGPHAAVWARGAAASARHQRPLVVSAQRPAGGEWGDGAPQGSGQGRWLDDLRTLAGQDATDGAEGGALATDAAAAAAAAVGTTWAHPAALALRVHVRLAREDRDGLAHDLARLVDLLRASRTKPQTQLAVLRALNQLLRANARLKAEFRAAAGFEVLLAVLSGLDGAFAGLPAAVSAPEATAAPGSAGQEEGELALWLASSCQQPVQPATAQLLPWLLAHEAMDLIALCLQQDAPGNREYLRDRIGFASVASSLLLSRAPASLLAPALLQSILALLSGIPVAPPELCEHAARAEAVRDSPLAASPEGAPPLPLPPRVQPQSAATSGEGEGHSAAAALTHERWRVRHGDAMRLLFLLVPHLRPMPLQALAVRSITAIVRREGLVAVERLCCADALAWVLREFPHALLRSDGPTGRALADLAGDLAAHHARPAEMTELLQLAARCVALECEAMAAPPAPAAPASPPRSGLAASAADTPPRLGAANHARASGMTLFVKAQRRYRGRPAPQGPRHGTADTSGPVASALQDVLERRPALRVLDRAMRSQACTVTYVHLPGSAPAAPGQAKDPAEHAADGAYVHQKGLQCERWPGSAGFTLAAWVRVPTHGEGDGDGDGATPEASGVRTVTDVATLQAGVRPVFLRVFFEGGLLCVATRRAGRPFPSTAAFIASRPLLAGAAGRWTHVAVTCGPPSTSSFAFREAPSVAVRAFVNGACAGALTLEAPLLAGSVSVPGEEANVYLGYCPNMGQLYQAPGTPHREARRTLHLGPVGMFRAALEPRQVAAIAARGPTNHTVLGGRDSAGAEHAYQFDPSAAAGSARSDAGSAGPGASGAGDGARKGRAAAMRSSAVAGARRAAAAMGRRSGSTALDAVEEGEEGEEEEEATTATASATATAAAATAAAAASSTPGRDDSRAEGVGDRTPSARRTSGSQDAPTGQEDDNGNGDEEDAEEGAAAGAAGSASGGRGGTQPAPGTGASAASAAAALAAARELDAADAITRQMCLQTDLLLQLMHAGAGSTVASAAKGTGAVVAQLAATASVRSDALRSGSGAGAGSSGGGGLSAFAAQDRASWQQALVQASNEVLAARFGVTHAAMSSTSASALDWVASTLSGLSEAGDDASGDAPALPLSLLLLSWGAEDAPDEVVEYAASAHVGQGDGPRLAAERACHPGRVAEALVALTRLRACGEVPAVRDTVVLQALPHHFVRASVTSAGSIGTEESTVLLTGGDAYGVDSELPECAGSRSRPASERDHSAALTLAGTRLSAEGGPGTRSDGRHSAVHWSLRDALPSLAREQGFAVLRGRATLASERSFAESVHSIGGPAVWLPFLWTPALSVAALRRRPHEVAALRLFALRAVARSVAGHTDAMWTMLRDEGELARVVASIVFDGGVPVPRAAMRRLLGMCKGPNPAMESPLLAEQLSGAASVRVADARRLWQRAGDGTALHEVLSMAVTQTRAGPVLAHPALLDRVLLRSHTWRALPLSLREELLDSLLALVAASADDHAANASALLAAGIVPWLLARLVEVHAQLARLREGVTASRQPPAGAPREGGTPRSRTSSRPSVAGNSPRTDPQSGDAMPASPTRAPVQPPAAAGAGGDSSSRARAASGSEGHGGSLLGPPWQAKALGQAAAAGSLGPSPDARRGAVPSAKGAVPTRSSSASHILPLAAALDRTPRAQSPSLGEEESEGTPTNSPALAPGSSPRWRSHRSLAVSQHLGGSFGGNPGSCNALGRGPTAMRRAALARLVDRLHSLLYWTIARWPRPAELRLILVHVGAALEATERRGGSSRGKQTPSAAPTPSEAQSPSKAGESGSRRRSTTRRRRQSTGRSRGSAARPAGADTPTISHLPQAAAKSLRIRLLRTMVLLTASPGAINTAHEFSSTRRDRMGQDSSPSGDEEDADEETEASGGVRRRQAWGTGAKTEDKTEKGDESGADAGGEEGEGGERAWEGECTAPPASSSATVRQLLCSVASFRWFACALDRAPDPVSFVAVFRLLVTAWQCDPRLALASAASEGLQLVSLSTRRHAQVPAVHFMLLALLVQCPLFECPPALERVRLRMWLPLLQHAGPTSRGREPTLTALDGRDGELVFAALCGLVRENIRARRDDHDGSIARLNNAMLDTLFDLASSNSALGIAIAFRPPFLRALVEALMSCAEDQDALALARRIRAAFAEESFQQLLIEDYVDSEAAREPRPVFYGRPKLGASALSVREAQRNAMQAMLGWDEHEGRDGRGGGSPKPGDGDSETSLGAASSAWSEGLASAQAERESPVSSLGHASDSGDDALLSGSETEGSGDDPSGEGAEGEEEGAEAGAEAPDAPKARRSGGMDLRALFRGSTARRLLLFVRLAVRSALNHPQCRTALEAVLGAFTPHASDDLVILYQNKVIWFVCAELAQGLEPSVWDIRYGGVKEDGARVPPSPCAQRLADVLAFLARHTANGWATHSAVALLHCVCDALHHAYSARCHEGAITSSAFTLYARLLDAARSLVLHLLTPGSFSRLAAVLACVQTNAPMLLLPLSEDAAAATALMDASASATVRLRGALPHTGAQPGSPLSMARTSAAAAARTRDSNPRADGGAFDGSPTRVHRASRVSDAGSSRGRSRGRGSFDLGSQRRGQGARGGAHTRRRGSLDSASPSRRRTRSVSDVSATSSTGSAGASAGPDSGQGPISGTAFPSTPQRQQFHVEQWAEEDGSAAGPEQPPASEAALHAHQWLRKARDLAPRPELLSQGGDATTKAGTTADGAASGRSEEDDDDEDDDSPEALAALAAVQGNADPLNTGAASLLARANQSKRARDGSHPLLYKPRPHDAALRRALQRDAHFVKMLARQSLDVMHFTRSPSGPSAQSNASSLRIMIMNLWKLLLVRRATVLQTVLSSGARSRDARQRQRFPTLRRRGESVGVAPSSAAASPAGAAAASPASQPSAVASHSPAEAAGSRISRSEYLFGASRAREAARQPGAPSTHRSKLSVDVASRAAHDGGNASFAQTDVPADGAPTLAIQRHSLFADAVQILVLSQQRVPGLDPLDADAVVAWFEEAAPELRDALREAGVGPARGWVQRANATPHILQAQQLLLEEQAQHPVASLSRHLSFVLDAQHEEQLRRLRACSASLMRAYARTEDEASVVALLAWRKLRRHLFRPGGVWDLRRIRLWPVPSRRGGASAGGAARAHGGVAPASTGTGCQLLDEAACGEARRLREGLEVWLPFARCHLHPPRLALDRVEGSTRTRVRMVYDPGFHERYAYGSSQPLGRQRSSSADASMSSATESPRHATPVVEAAGALGPPEEPDSTAAAPVEDASKGRDSPVLQVECGEQQGDGAADVSLEEAARARGDSNATPGTENYPQYPGEDVGLLVGREAVEVNSAPTFAAGSSVDDGSSAVSAPSEVSLARSDGTDYASEAVTPEGAADAGSAGAGAGQTARGVLRRGHSADALPRYHKDGDSPASAEAERTTGEVELDEEAEEEEEAEWEAEERVVFGEGDKGEEEGDEEEEPQNDTLVSAVARASAGRWGSVLPLLAREDRPPRAAYRCVRVAGLFSHEAVLLLCHTALYVVDGVTLSRRGRVVPSRRITSTIAGASASAAANETSSSTLPVEDLEVYVRGQEWQPGLARGDTSQPARRGRSLQAGRGGQAAPGATRHPLIAGSELKCQRIRYRTLREFHTRRYLLRHVGLELFDKEGRSLLVALETVGERDEVFDDLLHTPMPLSLLHSFAGAGARGKRSGAGGDAGAALPRRSRLRLVESSWAKWRRQMTDAWVNGLMSNFEYLMLLNTLAGRSYNDLTQYPVFPWVLTDYDSDRLNLENPDIYRDLSKPVGGLNPKLAASARERYQTVQEHQEELAAMGEEPDPSMLPYHWGAHYSNSGYVLHYLLRLEPFALLAARHQGRRFDAPDRLFRSVRESWAGARGDNTQDVRELVPEFFYMPEFLLNRGMYDLGHTQRGQLVHDVELPPWAGGDARRFVAVHRAALESEHVSHNLHKWIDLIFGHKQRGPAAEEACNLFHPWTYEGAVDFEALDPVTRSAAVLQIQEFGQTPRQLFLEAHPARRVTQQERMRALAIRVLEPPGDGAAHGTSAAVALAASNASARRMPIGAVGRQGPASLAAASGGLSRARPRGGSSSSSSSASAMGGGAETRRSGASSSSTKGGALARRGHSARSVSKDGGSSRSLADAAAEPALCVVDVDGWLCHAPLPKAVCRAFGRVNGCRTKTEAVNCFLGPWLARAVPGATIASGESVQDLRMVEGGRIRVLHSRHVPCTLVPPSWSKRASWMHADRSLRLRVAHISARRRQAGHLVLSQEHMHSSTVLQTAFTQDGAIVATSGADGLVRLWAHTRNPSSRERGFQRLHDLVGHTCAVRCLAFCEPHGVLATGDESGRVAMWDYHTGDHVRNLLPQGSPIVALSFNDATGDLFTATRAEVVLWSIRGYLLARVATTTSPQPYGLLTTMAATSKQGWQDGVTLITGHAPGTVVLWRARLEGARHAARGEDVSPTGEGAEGAQAVAVGRAPGLRAWWQNLEVEHPSLSWPADPSRSPPLRLEPLRAFGQHEAPVTVIRIDNVNEVVLTGDASGVAWHWSPHEAAVTRNVVHFMA